MLLMPKKIKHRKWHKGRGLLRAFESRGTKINFGNFGLKSLGFAWLTSRQIEAARRAITNHIQRRGKIWFRVFPDKPRTSKGQEMPMGGGKGSVEYYVATIKPGRIIFEMDGVPEELAKEAFRLAGHKLPMKTKFIKR